MKTIKSFSPLCAGVLLVIISLACSRLSFGSSVPDTEQEWDAARQKILKTLDGIETFKWSGTGVSSQDGKIAAAGWDSPGRYQEVDKYENGDVVEYIRVDGTYCTRNNSSKWSCDAFNLPTTMDILKNNVTGTVIFQGYVVVKSSATVETYKDSQYLVFTQEGSQKNTNSSYVDKEYFDVGTYYPAYAVIEWTYPDFKLSYEFTYSGFNEPVDPIEIPK